MLEGAFATHIGARHADWTTASQLRELITEDLAAAVGRGEFPAGVALTVGVRPLLLTPGSIVIVVTVHGLPAGTDCMSVPEWIEAEIRGTVDSGDNGTATDLADKISKYVNVYNAIDLALYGPERDERFGLVIDIAREDGPS